MSDELNSTVEEEADVLSAGEWKAKAFASRKAALAFRDKAQELKDKAQVALETNKELRISLRLAKKRAADFKDKFEHLLAENTVLRGKLEDAVSVGQRLKTQALSMKQEKTLYEKAIQDVRDQSSGAVKRVEELEAALRRHIEARKQYETKFVQLQNALRQEKARSQGFEQTAVDAVEGLRLKEAELASALEQVETLTSQLAETTREVSKISELRSLLDKERAAVKSLRESELQLQQNEISLVQELEGRTRSEEALHLRIEKITEQFRAVAAERTRLSERQELLEATRGRLEAEVESAQDEVRQVHENLVTLENANKSLQKQIQRLTEVEREKTILQQEFELYRSQNGDVESKLQNAETSLAAAERRLEEQEERLQQIPRLESKNAEFQNNLDQLNEKQAAYIAELERSRKQLEETRKELDQALVQIADLEVQTREQKKNLQRLPQFELENKEILAKLHGLDGKLAERQQELDEALEHVSMLEAKNKEQEEALEQVSQLKSERDSLQVKLETLRAESEKLQLDLAEALSREAKLKPELEEKDRLAERIALFESRVGELEEESRATRKKLDAAQHEKEKKQETIQFLTTQLQSRSKELEQAQKSSLDLEKCLTRAQEEEQELLLENRTIFAELRETEQKLQAVQAKLEKAEEIKEGRQSLSSLNGSAEHGEETRKMREAFVSLWELVTEDIA